MSFVINPYRFGGGAPPGGTLPTPLHWFDLNDDGVWADDGDSATLITLTEPVGNVTVNATAGVNGQAVAAMSGGGHLTGGSVPWDGTQVGGEDHISFASWYKITTYSADGSVIIAWREGDANPYICQINNNKATEQIRVAVGDTTPDYVTANGANNTADEGVWIHCAVTWDGTTLRNYKNGVEIATGTNASTGNFTTANVPFNLGHIDNQVSSDLFGFMGATGIWDVALSATEVSDLYERVNTDGTDGYYADYTWT